MCQPPTTDHQPATIHPKTALCLGCEKRVHYDILQKQDAAMTPTSHQLNASATFSLLWLGLAWLCIIVCVCVCTKVNGDGDNVAAAHAGFSCDGSYY